MRNPLTAAPILAALLTGLTGPALAETSVVATIKPLHSLVAGVMEGVGTPTLLIPGTTSPHTFTLKPSDARKLEDARVVFWIGPDLETALEHPLETLATKATVETLMNAPGITQRGFPEGHDHDHGHDADHKDADHKDHDHKDAAHKDHDHDKDGHKEAEEHGHHHHGTHDPHVWLDPKNAEAMLAAIAATLSDVMPEHGDAFAANAARMTTQFTKLGDEVTAILEPVSGKPFLTFHDALGHFNARYGLTKGEAIVVNPEIKPGAKRIAELREEIEEEGFACVFIEPQFDPSIAEVIVEGSDAKIATLDPLGSALPEGPALYADLIRGIAQTLHDCMAD